MRGNFIPNRVNDLVNDFDTFLDYLEFEEIILTKKNNYLKRKDLHQINQMMSKPNPDVSKHNDQPLYPRLNLFYYLGLNGKLFIKKGQTKGYKVGLSLGDRSSEFRKLTILEKYFFLLETMWVDTDWKELQTANNSNLILDTVSEVIEIISSSEPDSKIDILPGSTLKKLLIDWGAFLKYFALFGFWELIEKETEAKKNYQVEGLTPSSFGVKLFDILNTKRPITAWNQQYNKKLKNKEKYGADIISIFDFQDTNKTETIIQESTPDEKKQVEKPGEEFFLPFKPFFPEADLNKSLPRKENKFFEGNIVFKIALYSKVWRKIKISGNHTLADLHLIIQEAFNFDNDHLYSFFMDGKVWSENCYNSPHDSTGPYADEIKIGNLELYVGRQFLYLFDYGDMWKIQVTITELTEDETELSQSQIIKKSGPDPEQYNNMF